MTKCDICNVDLEYTRIKDIDSGDVLVTCLIKYCPECLMVFESDVNLSE